VTSLKHEKITAKISGAITQIFLPSHNSMYEKQAQFYKMLHHSHESSPFPMTFSPRSKAIVTTTLNQVLRGKQMWMMV
jgi:hypothetical protein